MTTEPAGARLTSGQSKLLTELGKSPDMGMAILAHENASARALERKGLVRLERHASVGMVDAYLSDLGRRALAGGRADG